MRNLLALLLLSACQPESAPVGVWHDSDFVWYESVYGGGWVLDPVFRNFPSATMDAWIAQGAADAAMLVEFPSPPFGDR